MSSSSSIGFALRAGLISRSTPHPIFESLSTIIGSSRWTGACFWMDCSLCTEACLAIEPCLDWVFHFVGILDVTLGPPSDTVAMRNSHLIPEGSLSTEIMNGFPGVEYIASTGTPRLSARATAAYEISRFPVVITLKSLTERRICTPS